MVRQSIPKKDIIKNLCNRQIPTFFQAGMLAVVQCARDKISYFVDRLYESMDGVGTDDKTLIRIMVSRSEKDLLQIKRCFEDKHKKPLEDYISSECNGDYKKLLIQVCRGNAIV